jgi:hypothetical protein
VILSPALLALGLGLGLILLIPARRLQLAGLTGRSIGVYALVLWMLGFLAALRPGPLRLLIPILLVAYIAPFVASPEFITRLLHRGRGTIPPGPPMKDVTPPDDRPD